MKDFNPRPFLMHLEAHKFVRQVFFLSLILVFDNYQTCPVHFCPVMTFFVLSKLSKILKQTLWYLHLLVYH